MVKEGGGGEKEISIGEEQVSHAISLMSCYHFHLIFVQGRSGRPLPGNDRRPLKHGEQ